MQADMWIDTHCHLDATEFAGQHRALAERAAALGVAAIVIPAVEAGNFAAVAGLAHENANCAYALGIHPLFVPAALESDLGRLRAALTAAMADPRLVAIGEIGLDFFVPSLCQAAQRQKQEHFYWEQLKMARELGLPVLLHVRRSQDTILKYLRRVGAQGGIGGIGGIAHAFNGSFQQAEAFIKLGFKLGFGGAMTFPRALQIRRLASHIPLSALVLETDAPDISPVWLHPQKNCPAQIPRIGGVLATLRGLRDDELALASTANALAALPRLASLIRPGA